MPRVNFSKETEKVYDLALDLGRDCYSLHIDSEKISKKDLETHLRNKINNDILRGATLYQAYRRNNLVLFEVIEELVNTVISEDVVNSEFMDIFVEYKNRHLGDTTAFTTDGGILTASTFSGNHWNTNRQQIDVGTEVILPKEWVYVRVYDDLERFLLGVSTLEKIVDKIYKAINRYIQERMFATFSNIGESIPSEFKARGNTEEAIGDLCDLIAGAGGYSQLTIAGTKSALRKFAKAIPDKFFADSQREAKAMSGTIKEWEGNLLLPIPQILKKGELKVALPNDKVYIFGADTKPIKLEFIGDTRTKEDATGKDNMDMTVDLQVQTKIGMGLVMPAYVGEFTIA